MYCRQCGKELTNDAKFCAFCGAPCEEMSEPPKQQDPPPNSNRSQITCPRCGSQNTQPVVHTSAQVHTGGYSCLGGACGGILLGPVGLLLGLCGRSSTTQISSQTRWVCGDCGMEFSCKQDEEKRLRFLLSSAFIMIITTYVLTLLGLLGAYTAIGSACFTLALAFFMFSLIAWFSCRKGSCYQLEDLFAEEELQSLENKYTATKIMFFAWIPYILALSFRVRLLNGVL